MIIITFVDGNQQFLEEFSTWKEAKSRALLLSKLGFQKIKVVRSAK